MPSDATIVLLVGAGGHARVCLEALLDDSGLTVIGAVSRDGAGVEGLGVPMAGTDDDLSAVADRLGATAAFVAIGDNASRARVTAGCTATGLELVTAVSRFAMVSHTAVVHRGAVVLPGAVVNAATVIEEGAIVNTNASVDHDSRIGRFVHVAPGSALGGDVTIGDGVLVGLGSRVLPGITIGEGAIVGAGAVVVHDVPAGAVMIGCPARVVRMVSAVDP